MPKLKSTITIPIKSEKKSEKIEKPKQIINSSMDNFIPKTNKNNAKKTNHFEFKIHIIINFNIFNKLNWSSLIKIRSTSGAAKPILTLLMFYMIKDKKNCKK
jgi:hypothetical protein